MSTDKALANFELLWSLRGGDTGKVRVEHRSFSVEIHSQYEKKKRVTRSFMNII